MLFILSRLLGGNTFSRQIIHVMESIGNIEPHFVFLDPEDYWTYGDRIPRFARVTKHFESQHIMRLKLRAEPPPPCEAVFLQGFELMTCLSELPPTYPAIIAHDSTNVSSYRLIRDENPGWKASVIYWAKKKTLTPRYKRAMRSARIFMPRTHWAADSLIHDFGVDPRNIIVTPAGLDLGFWSPCPDKKTGNQPTLLFVGNDFERKGGPLLLEAFSDYVYPRARLLIVSNDPALSGITLPPGVEHLAWLKQGDRPALVKVFRESDIFVFPTRKEQMGMVLTEAAAVGLPIVATDVGGVGEVVRNGENGVLMNRTATAEEWGAVINDLIYDENKRKRFGYNSRSLAEKEFSKQMMQLKLETALARLKPEPQSSLAVNSAITISDPVVL